MQGEIWSLTEMGGPPLAQLQPPLLVPDLANPAPVPGLRHLLGGSGPAGHHVGSGHQEGLSLEDVAFLPRGALVVNGTSPVLPIHRQ